MLKAGVVKRTHESYGFIRLIADGGDVYFVPRDVRRGRRFAELQPGDCVALQYVETPNGKRATYVDAG